MNNVILIVKTILIASFFVTDTWKCPQCTFMNDGYKSKCTACGAYNGMLPNLLIIHAYFTRLSYTNSMLIRNN